MARSYILSNVKLLDLVLDPQIKHPHLLLPPVHHQMMHQVKILKAFLILGILTEAYILFKIFSNHELKIIIVLRKNNKYSSSSWKGSNYEFTWG